MASEARVETRHHVPKPIRRVRARGHADLRRRNPDGARNAWKASVGTWKTDPHTRAD